MENNFLELSQEEELKWQEFHQMELRDYQQQCDYCKKNMYKIIKAPQDIDVEIWKWTTTCWKCQKDTEIVWPVKESSEFLWESLTPQSFKYLPEAMQNKFSFFKTIEKRTMGVVEHGNTCSSCGAYQGDWFVQEDLLELSYAQENVEKSHIRIQLTGEEQVYNANRRQILKMHSPRKGLYSKLCEPCFALYKKKLI